MKLLILFILIPISIGLSQTKISKSNIIQMYNEFSDLDDSFSLSELNKLVDEHSKNAKLVVDKELHQKYLQTQQYVSTKEKLKDCLESSDTEMVLNLDKAIIGVLNRDIKNRDLNTLLVNCERLNDVAKNLEKFEQVLEAFKPDEQYKYYSHVQEQLYKEAMGNAMRTYGDLLQYEYKGTPEAWKEYLEKELTKNFCRPSSGELKKVKAIKDIPTNEMYFGKTGQICDKLARDVTEELNKRERVTLDEAAEFFNTMVEHLNIERSEALASVKGRDYRSYRAAYQAILSRSPGTLLLTDVLQDPETGIGPLQDEETLHKESYGGYHKQLDTKSDKHLKTLSTAIDEAKKKTKEGIENIHQDFYQRDQDDFDSQKFFHLYGKIQKGRRKSSIEDIVKYYPSAAAQMLADDPFHVYAICEAIISAEKSKKRKDKIDNAVMWGGVIVGGVLVATGIGAAAGVGGIIGAIGATAATSGMVLGIADAAYSTQVALERYEEYKHHETALYANNSTDIKALDESYKGYKSALISAGFSLGFSAINVASLQKISKLKPKEIKEITTNIKNLPPKRTIQDVKEVIIKTAKPPPGLGAIRAFRHGHSWKPASIKNSVRKFAGDNPIITFNKIKGKKIYTHPETGIQVVEDLNGNYFRVFDPKIKGKRAYFDLDGNIPNNKVLENGKKSGRSRAEYNEVTHFRIEDGQ